MALLTCSIRTGLAASTVTPGSTPPDESLATPASPLASCADAGAGTRRKESATTVRVTRYPAPISSASLPIGRNRTRMDKQNQDGPMRIRTDRQYLEWPAELGRLARK